MIDVIVWDNENQFAQRLSDALQGEKNIEVTAVVSAATADTAISERSAAILLIGPDEPVKNALAFAERLERARLNVGSILATRQISTELLRNALRAGFRDVVSADDSGDIVAAIKRAYEFIDPSGAASDDASKPAQPGRVITFFSTKGGVGKTVFAANTAAGLARQEKGRVVLLDMDNQFGDIGVVLGLKPERTIADAITSIDRLDADLLEGFLSRHASGLQALLAPVQHEISERITPAQIEKIIEAARRAADFVIVDTPASFSENTLAVLDNSDCICLVTMLDVPSVKNTQIALQNLSLLNYPESKIKLLLNRADSKVSLTPGEVEKHLKHEITVEIPSSLAIPRSVNEGLPLLMEDQRSAVAQALNKIVELAADVQPYQTLERRINKVGQNEL